MTTRWRIGRRTLLGGGAAMIAAAALPAGRWLFDRESELHEGAFGPLVPDPNGIFDLLEGFRYRVIDRSGSPMSDGHRVPRRPDGMACFPGEDADSIVLMRNHEMPNGIAGRIFGFSSSTPTYDPHAAGGVTRVVLDARTFEKRSSNLVLAGTVMNCAGGASPWGWLSCEETAEPGHGYVFACDPSTDRAAPPVRIDGYGRFRHEAVAIDPERAIAYLTEDQGDGCLYRFVPHDPAQPFEGRLQALRVRSRPGEDTSRLTLGVRREIDWIDLSRTADDELRHRARAAGAASFKRGEGICTAGDGTIYACMSTGGPVEGGQLFALNDEGDGGTLEVFGCADRGTIDMPDNICVAPTGSLFLVEDGPGHDCVRVVTSDGEISVFARNATSESEMCGVCFSPDGRAMFVNLQEDGLTLAVTGPFERLVV